MKKCEIENSFTDMIVWARKNIEMSVLLRAYTSEIVRFNGYSDDS